MLRHIDINFSKLISYTSHLTPFKSQLVLNKKNTLPSKVINGKTLVKRFKREREHDKCK